MAQRFPCTTRRRPRTGAASISISLPCSRSETARSTGSTASSPTPRRSPLTSGHRQPDRRPANLSTAAIIYWYTPVVAPPHGLWSRLLTADLRVCGPERRQESRLACRNSLSARVFCDVRHFGAPNRECHFLRLEPPGYLSPATVRQRTGRPTHWRDAVQLAGSSDGCGKLGCETAVGPDDDIAEPEPCCYVAQLGRQL